MNFTDDQKKEIEQLAGLNYTIKQIALYFAIDAIKLQKEFEIPASQFRYHFDRGRLIAQSEIDMQSLSLAKGGNITAMQRLDKIRKSKQFEIIRDQTLSEAASVFELDRCKTTKVQKQHNGNSGREI